MAGPDAKSPQFSPRISSHSNSQTRPYEPRGSRGAHSPHLEHSAAQHGHHDTRAERRAAATARRRSAQQSVSDTSLPAVLRHLDKAQPQSSDAPFALGSSGGARLPGGRSGRRRWRSAGGATPTDGAPAAAAAAAGQEGARSRLPWAHRHAAVTSSRGQVAVR